MTDRDNWTIEKRRNNDVVLAPGVKSKSRSDGKSTVHNLCQSQSETGWPAAFHSPIAERPGRDIGAVIAQCEHGIQGVLMICTVWGGHDFAHMKTKVALESINPTKPLSEQPKLILI